MTVSVCISVLLFGFATLTGCRESESTDANEHTAESKISTTANSFNVQDSDAKAIAIADSVMKAMGGRENWNQTKIVQWNFFGRRTHTWNKQTGRDSIHVHDQNLVIDMNLNSKKGNVWQNNRQVTNPDSLQKYLQQGFKIWTNDAYWLLMPYKLKNSGVTLNYLGLDSTQTGEPAHKLKLTFDRVGITPENMYHVWVDTAGYLVRQWAYFPKADMSDPQFVLPWKGYRKYGRIMLSGNRGKYSISDIEVMDNWPDSKDAAGNGER